MQHCTTASQVRYCLYPGFGRDLSSIEAPVNEVLALLPARPSQPLTVRQVLSVDFTDPSLTRGQPQQQVSQWTAQTRNAPGNITAASAIYLDVGEWPTPGGWLTYADFNLALATADWAVGFTPASQNLPYLPGDQAREAIAIWLAILATHPPPANSSTACSGRSSVCSGAAPRPPRSGANPARGSAGSRRPRPSSRFPPPCTCWPRP